MPVEPSQMEGAIDLPTVKEPNAVTSTLGLVAGLAGVGSGAIRLAEGGNKASGATELASGAVTAAHALGADIPYAGPALALAQIGEGAAQGGQAGDRAAVQGAASLAASAVPGIGAVFTVGNLAQTLINLGLGEYKQGDLSKAIMNAKQQHLYQYGNQAEEQALKAAPNFLAALRALSAAPSGTSGQIQWGVGAQYAGETIPNSSGTTETAGWTDLLHSIADPALIANDPDLVANFVDNLWVQTGPSGATGFNPGATRNYQVGLLSKLPNTPEWIAAKQKILNSDAVDPRTRSVTAPAVPDLPVEANVLRVNGLRIPTDHQYRWFDGASGIWYDYAPERVAQVASPLSASNIMDVTTGRWIGKENSPRGAVDPTYEDQQGMATPAFKAKVQAAWADYQRRPEAYSSENVSAMAQFLGLTQAPPPGPTLEQQSLTAYSPSYAQGGYVAAKVDRPVPITVHGGEYVVPRGPLAEGLKAVLGLRPLRPEGATG